MRRLAPALVAATLALGCTSTVTPADIFGEAGEFHVDVEFTPEQVRALEAAAATWNHYGNGYVSLTIVQDLDTRSSAMALKCVEGCVVHALSTDGKFQDMDSRHPDLKTLGVATGVRGTTILLAVDRLTDLDMFGEVALHEFGHSVGMAHVSSPHAVMYPHYHRGANCPNADDMLEFCRVQDCDLADVQYCK